METKCGTSCEIWLQCKSNSKQFTRVIARKILDEVERAICTSVLAGESCIVRWVGTEAMDCEGVVLTVDIQLQEVNDEGVRDLQIG